VKTRPPRAEELRHVRAAGAPAARMDLLRWIVFGVLPAVAAVLLGVGAGGPKLLALSLALALCVPFGLLGEWPPWPWELSLHHGDPFAWLWWTIAAAGAVGVAYDGKLLPRGLLFVLEIAIVAIAPWLWTGRLRAGWTFEQCVCWLGAGAAVVATTWWVLRRVATVKPGMAVPLVGAIALLADTLVLRAFGEALSWQLAGVAAVALGLACATTIWRRPFVCGTGGAFTIALVHAGLLCCGRSDGQLQREALLLALLAPPALGVAATRVFAEGRATGVVVGVAVTAAIAMAAVAAV
jgi:hypothetical protein